MRKILFLVLGIIFFNFNSAFALNLKQEEGKFLVENSFYQVTITEKGGSIKSLILRETGNDLTMTGMGNDLEITEGQPGNRFVIYNLTIEKKSKKQIFLKASAKGITKGDKTESRVILAKRKRIREANSAKILITGGIDGNLRNYHLYNIGRSLKFLPSLQLEISECLSRMYPRYETHFLKGFPVSLTGLSAYKAIILIDIPSWVFTERDQNNLLSYVKEGGNLILVGDHARGYKGTRFAETIPLEFDYTKEVKGYSGRILKDKSAWLRPIIVDKNNPIIRGLPLNIPKIVVHKSKIKQGKLILNCGDYPLLAKRDYGKGKIISFPISLTDKVVPASYRPPDVKYDFWNDKLINWSFYGELWRNIILYSLNKMPSVDFSQVTPPEKIITYPASIKLSAEITNFSNISQEGSISFTLYKNKKEVRKEDTKYSLSPKEKKKMAFKVELGYPRGDYSYNIDIKNRKGNILSYLDGTFSALPRTYLKAELPIIPVFGRGSSMNLSITSFNLNKKNQYQIKTSLFDFRGKRIEELSPVEVIPPKELYSSSKEIKQNLPLGNLMKGNYQIEIELLENEKEIDIVKKDIFLVPSLEEEDLYPNIIYGIATTDKEQTLKDTRKKKEMGFNGIQIYNWSRYKRGSRDYNSARVGFYAFQEAQRLGMLFCPHSSYGQRSWNRWWRGCPNTIISKEVEKKDIEDIEDYLSLYESSPKHFATYVADEPGINYHKSQKCPVCQKAFKDKYGYEMPAGKKDKNYYTAYKFICDKNVESLKKAISFVKKYNPKLKLYGAFNRCGSLRGGLNINGIVSILDIVAVDHYEYGKDPYCLDLLWGASNFKNNIWLVPNTCIARGGVYFPRYIGTQVYNALCHNAKGLDWFLWKACERDLLGDPERVEYGKRVFKELKEIGPLFKHLTKKRARVAMLHPWTTLVFDTVRSSVFYQGLPVLHTLFRQAFGQVDILQEEQIRKNSFLPDYNVLFLPASTTCIPEDVMKGIKEWVKEGGLLIVFPGTALYNEYQEKSTTLSDIFSVSYGKEVSLPVRGVGVLPVSGYVLNSANAKVLCRYTNNEAAVIENSYGKGRVICFGFVPKSGKILEEVTKGIDTGVIKSSNKNVDIGFFDDQSTYYIVAVNQGRQEEKANILLKVPNKRYYIYDFLTGKEVDYSYKDNNLIISVELEPLWGRVLAVLEEKPAKVSLALDSGGYTRGKLLTYKIRLFVLALSCGYK